MEHFDSDGIDIAYLDQGEGEPILLIHGFASNVRINWVGTGWVERLVDAGRRVIAIDNRGHGRSEKVYDKALYEAPMMAEDSRRLIEHLGLGQVDVLGYSMGARIAAFLAINHPEKVGKVVFGGLGMGMVKGVGDPEAIAQALEAPSLADVEGVRGRAFRKFAESAGGDLKALAACMRSARQRISPEQVGSLRCPVLVAVGTDDDVAGSASELAALIPGARVLDIPGRDHMMAVGAEIFKTGVLEFLAARD
jgi:pimeloyl-ACP methyl ester carboxylesterase